PPLPRVPPLFLPATAPPPPPPLPLHDALPIYARSPPTSAAEAAGIGSSTSPRRRSSAASSSDCDGASCRSSASPSGSPVVVVDVRSTSVTYRLSRPTKHGANLVAAPDNRTKSPVANGS